MASSRFVKNGVRTILQKAGYDLVRKQVTNPAATSRAIMMRHHGIQTVLDVGANMGQYSTELREWGFQGRIISFEPTSAAFKALSERAAADGNWNVFNFAVGAEDGEAEISITSNAGASSSLMPMLDSHRDCAPEIKFVATEKVKVKTLDNALANVIAPGDVLMLKMDVQGFEHLVLRGATAVLQGVQIIECELSFVPLYDGQLVFSQMLEIIDSLGFTPVNFNPIFWHPVTGHSLCVDGVFARVEHTSSGKVLASAQA
jgi:FkbM family methyltransferase